MNGRQIVLAHELDAAWIIALWKFLHGGDPGPEEVAGEVIAAMSLYLKRAENSLTQQHLTKQLASLGAEVIEPEVLEEKVETGPRRPRQYCFKFKGETICIPLPNLKNVAVAA
jgi:hypothetical protein